MARGATHASRWVHEPHPISNHPVRLGFPHRVGWYRCVGSPFWSPGSSICGWDLILPGFGRTSTLSLEATLASRWVHEPQSISIQIVVLGFPTVWGGIDRLDLHFSPRVVQYGDETLSSTDWAGPRPCLERQFSPRAGCTRSSQSATSQWGWGFRTVWGGVDLGGVHVRPPVVGGIYVWKVSGDWNLSSPEYACSMHDPQQTSDQPLRFVSPHRVGWY